MAKRKTLRLKKRKTRRYRGGFAPFPNVDVSDPNTVAFIRSYFMANRTMLEDRYQIETPNHLYAQIRELQLQPNHPLYDDLKRKYEEFMMAM
jgi:hypothetical protein